MKRRFRQFGAIFLLLLLLCAVQVRAEVYIDREPPRDWENRDILTLTAFRQFSNDTALLEVGGMSVLIDGGVKGAKPKLEKALKELGHEGYVNLFYNTHPHEDHLGAVQYLVREGFRADCFISTFPEDYQYYNWERNQKYMVQTLREHEIPYRQIENGECMEIGKAQLVFHYNPEGKTTNALSSIMHLTFGNATLLMTADIESVSMRYFHEHLDPELMKADIMKFPHHGVPRMVNEFLDDVQPKFVYITNYTQATPDANRQLELRGISYKHTSVGRIVMKTDGTDWYIMQYPGVY